MNLTKTDYEVLWFLRDREIKERLDIRLLFQPLAKIAYDRGTFLKNGGFIEQDDITFCWVLTFTGHIALAAYEEKLRNEKQCTEPERRGREPEVAMQQL